MSTDSDEAMVACAGFIGIVVGIFLFIIYITIASAVLLSSFWAWFILPIFPALPALTIVNAVAIGMFYNALNGSYLKAIEKYNETRKNPKETSESIGLFIAFAIGPWIALLIGWVFKTIFM